MEKSAAYCYDADEYYGAKLEKLQKKYAELKDKYDLLKKNYDFILKKYIGDDI